jgi:glucokinase
MTYAIGIDLGGTKLNVGLVDKEGNIVDKILVKTDIDGGPVAIINQMKTAIKDLMAKHKKQPTAVGVGLAGQITRDGSVSFAPNLKWKDIPFKKMLHQEVNLPIHVMNDVRAATWAEWNVGSGKGSSDILCIFIGTGIGGGIVSGGHLLTGANNSAGEIGHIVIDMHGPRCTCGNNGCWEAYVGGWGIAERTRERIVENPKKGERILELADNTLENVSAKILEKAYREKDPLAHHLINELSHALVAGTVSVLNAFNPRRLIFGGGVIKGLPEFIHAVREGVKHRALGSSLHDLEILEAKIVVDAPMIGAALYALENHHD